MVFLVFTPDSFIIMLQGIVSKENEVDSRGRSTDHHLAHIMTLPIPTQRLNQATMALLLWAAMSSFIFLQAADYQSQTTKDPDISVEFLKLRVIPLEKFELQVETEAWQELLKSKATEIIELEIQEISAEGKEEDQINQRVAEKVRERTLIADRMTIVMNAFQTKGGDLAEYKEGLSVVQVLIEVWTAGSEKSANTDAFASSMDSSFSHFFAISGSLACIHFLCLSDLKGIYLFSLIQPVLCSQIPFKVSIALIYLLA